MSVEQLLRAGLSASTLRTEFEAVGERCAQPAGFLVGGPSLAPQRHPGLLQGVAELPGTWAGGASLGVSFEKGRGPALRGCL